MTSFSLPNAVHAARFLFFYVYIYIYTENRLNGKSIEQAIVFEAFYFFVNCIINKNTYR